MPEQSIPVLQVGVFGGRYSAGTKTPKMKGYRSVLAPSARLPSSRGSGRPRAAPAVCDGGRNLLLIGKKVSALPLLRNLASLLSGVVFIGEPALGLARWRAHRPGRESPFRSRRDGCRNTNESVRIPETIGGVIIAIQAGRPRMNRRPVLRGASLR